MSQFTFLENKAVKLKNVLIKILSKSENDFKNVRNIGKIFEITSP